MVPFSINAIDTSRSCPYRDVLLHRNELECGFNKVTTL
jgi:hypothetical protein